MSGSDKIIILISALAVLLAGFWVYKMLSQPLNQPDSNLPPIDLMEEPIQSDAQGTALPITNRGKLMYIFTAKASYRIAGMNVSKQRYHKGHMSKISPYDYALVWGEVPQHMQHLKFEQVVRFCLMRHDNTLPLTLEYLYTHMSNNHLIPANKNISKALSLGRKGDQVVLDGYLVNVVLGKKGRTIGVWNTSLDRTDKGSGACEIIYLTRLRINDRVFE